MKMFNKCLFVALLLFFQAAYSDDVPKADAVLVIKSEKRLYLLRQGEQIASLRVAFGSAPVGTKRQEGDGRTPEGRYVLDYKNIDSQFYKSIHVSYPNSQDREQARERGVSPGGDIMIHGQANGWEWASLFVQLFSWTDGCIALSNSDMERVWNSVDPGTPIEIRP
jgi:murein L,D-transpeptidase YafK